MADLWTRREFNRTLGLTLLGGIFVPKFGRWFQPNRILVPSGPPVFVGHSVVDWPAHQAGDMALMIISSEERAVPLTPGWRPWMESDHTAVYWKQAGSSREERPRFSKRVRSPQILTFRGVAKGEGPVNLTMLADVEHPGITASLTVARG